MYRLNNNDRRAFTLVELLVVVAIIALLLGILLPALSKARDVAKKTVCMTHQKQLATAWFTFVSEHGQALAQDGSSTSGLQWPVLLMDYYDQQDNVLVCPVAPEPKNPQNYKQQSGANNRGTSRNAWTLTPIQYKKVQKEFPGNTMRFWGGYCYNDWLSTNHKNGFETLGSIRFASQTPVFSGGFLRSGSVNEEDTVPTQFEEPVSAKGGIWKVAVDRHDGELNVAYADSSARSVPLTADGLLNQSFWHKNWDLSKVRINSGGGGGGGR